MPCSGAGREALVVWGRDGSGPFSYGGGDEQLQSCLKGADALALSSALDGLSDRGAAFQLTVHDSHGRQLVARGRAVGGMAAVWLEEPAAVAEQGADFRAILDALPIPVWLRDKALALTWGNHAFLHGAGAKDLETARREQTALDKPERDLAASARSQNAMQESKRFSVVGGQRRALAFTEIPLGDAGIIGTAIDVTDVAAAEARLQQHVDAHADTLDKLQTAVAIFGKDQKLTFYNRAFVKLWGLPETWLDRHPSDGEILDRLREARKLPEQRDYQAWKRERLALYQDGARAIGEELWHLPGGQTMRVVTQPHPFGGLTFLYEDVTERLTLESNYNTLIKVQSATLDTLERRRGGVRSRRQAQAAQRRLRPHLGIRAQTIWQASRMCAPSRRLSRDHFGDSAIWDQLIQAIVSGAAQQRDLGDVERSDRSILSLVHCRRCRTAPRWSPSPTSPTASASKARCATATRRWKRPTGSSPISSSMSPTNCARRSTPSWAFPSIWPAACRARSTPSQGEYVQAIVTGGNTLKSLVNDILDLALVESGALRLELERIDLYELIERCRRPCPRLGGQDRA